ncbi:hypothetical protein [Mycoplasmopsis verecunda]|uniref:Uncharacterized protein n=1 Tax=Mycoplasmopsis verecunda TaxID=171291 RepID=A0A1T4LFY2_9BACT|nr:hypothetical protein [Mycoplasmopsis verecunda]WPB54847.1 hypothetical protein SAM46_01680 [Mycoplasmopsis verecunda]SJZ53507.1 hypothetical protein SAMN02745154_00436 [Mycoplasmopsis verecunda]
MRQGLKKFKSETQGARTREGALIGENFVRDILEAFGIEDLSKTQFQKQFYYETITIRTSLKPDFIINNSSTGKNIYKGVDYLFIESKFKQISGSDWEKLESNFGFHDWFYNELCNVKCKTIVILTGYWSILERKYPLFMNYFKLKYGKETIFDFASQPEIKRFARFLNVDWTDELDKKVSEIYNKYQQIK